MSVIILPFPAASLSGHTAGHWRTKHAATAKHRGWAKSATLAAAPHVVPASGDIHLRVCFVPPDRRSDRANYPVRMKAYFDGIAEALGVNDRRFLPNFVFSEPEKPGRVEVSVEAFAPQGSDA